jgi:hypothetical protein
MYVCISFLTYVFMSFLTNECMSLLTYEFMSFLTYVWMSFLTYVCTSFLKAWRTYALVCMLVRQAYILVHTYVRMTCIRQEWNIHTSRMKYIHTSRMKHLYILAYIRQAYILSIFTSSIYAKGRWGWHTSMYAPSLPLCMYNIHTHALMYGFRV